MLRFQGRNYVQGAMSIGQQSKLPIGDRIGFASSLPCLPGSSAGPAELEVFEIVGVPPATAIWGGDPFGYLVPELG